MKRIFTVLAACVAVSAIGAAVVQAQISSGVPNANPRSGSPANVLAPGWSQTLLATRTDTLENPSAEIQRFGELNDGPGTTANRPFATKTEPDINTYLASTSNLRGPQAGYDYGRHYLFQGHENSTGNAYVTRINLDVPRTDSHRITLLTPVNGAGATGLSRVDGSTYDPFTRTVLFSQESSATSGGFVQIPVDYSAGFQDPTAAATSLYGSMGRGGYEGVRVDRGGNVTFAEDIGGSGVSVDPAQPNATSKPGRVPNSFVYRFVPTDKTNLTAGKLYALQVRNAADTAITFGGHGGGTDAAPLPCTGAQPGVAPAGGSKAFCDAWAQDQVDLHTPGSSLKTKWVQVHDTVANGNTAFDANALAKAAGATPLKRPETVAYIPDTGFRSFVFSATGDTDANAAPLASAGSWGSVLRVDLDDTTATSDGRISVVVLGDSGHTGFDNVVSYDAHTVWAGEDRGDKLHGQLNMLDSLWSIDLESGGYQRLVALGRDPSATADAALREAVPPTPGFQNDGDNEVTGPMVSDGSLSTLRIQDDYEPGLSARMFFTQQHGDNNVYELTAPSNQGPPGTPGTPGATGGNGNDGAPGAEGPGGSQGPGGATGPAGPRGPRGRRGRAGKVTCKVRSRRRVRCRVSRSSRGARARLTRGHTLYASGTGARLVARRRMRPGLYTLTTTYGSRVVSTPARVR